MARGALSTESGQRTPRITDAFRSRAFAVFFLAESQSIAGDQLARVALSVLVFERTGSATATGLTFAATFLPAIFGGSLLGRLGDRFPRRRVMASVDLIRAALFGVMAIPGMATPSMIALLVAAVFVGPVFGAAGVSYLAAHLGHEVFRAGTGLRMLSSQGFQVLGFAVGGVAVAAWGPRTVLAIDALTFVCSALLIALLAPADPPQRPRPETVQAKGVRGVLWSNPRTRTLVALSALAGFFVAPEGVAVPFAAELHHSATAAGLLLAAPPLGSVFGIYLLVRKVPAARRTSAMSVMVVACGLPLVLSGAVDSLPLSFACWLVSGVCAAYQVEVLTQLVQSIPDQLRSRTLGVCNAVLLGAQGIGVAVFGAVSEGWTAQAAVGLAGGIGAALALWLVAGPLRRSSPASTF